MGIKDFFGDKRSDSEEYDDGVQFDYNEKMEENGMNSAMQDYDNLGGFDGYSSSSSQVQVVLYRPINFNEVTEIADSVNVQKTVIINLESMEKTNVIRLLDFLSGVCYANQAQLKKVSAATYMVTPKTVSVSGDSAPGDESYM